MNSKQFQTKAKQLISQHSSVIDYVNDNCKCLKDLLQPFLFIAKNPKIDKDAFYSEWMEEEYEFLLLHLDFFLFSLNSFHEKKDEETLKIYDEELFLHILNQSTGIFTNLEDQNISNRLNKQIDGFFRRSISGFTDLIEEKTPLNDENKRNLYHIALKSINSMLYNDNAYLTLYILFDHFEVSSKVEYSSTFSANTSAFIVYTIIHRIIKEDFKEFSQRCFNQTFLDKIIDDEYFNLNLLHACLELYKEDGEEESILDTSGSDSFSDLINTLWNDDFDDLELVDGFDEYDDDDDYPLEDDFFDDDYDFDDDDEFDDDDDYYIDEDDDEFYDDSEFIDDLDEENIDDELESISSNKKLKLWS